MAGAGPIVQLGTLQATMLTGLGGFIAGAGQGLIENLTGDKKGINLDSALSSYLNNKITPPKPKKEEETGHNAYLRAYTGSQKVVSQVVGSLPTMFQSSIGRDDLSVAEYAMKTESDTLKMRIEFNSGQWNRYINDRKFKRNTNAWFSCVDIHNELLNIPGFYKFVIHNIERDPAGLFARIFNAGTYCYQDEPQEYYTMKALGNQASQGVVNIVQTGVITEIVENFSTSIGNDDYVHLDGRSWIYHTSYFTEIESGKNLLSECLEGRFKTYNSANPCPPNKVFQNQPNNPNFTQFPRNTPEWDACEHISKLTEKTLCYKGKVYQSEARTEIQSYYPQNTTKEEYEQWQKNKPKGKHLLGINKEQYLRIVKGGKISLKGNWYSPWYNGKEFSLPDNIILKHIPKIEPKIEKRIVVEEGKPEQYFKNGIIISSVEFWEIVKKYTIEETVYQWCNAYDIPAQLNISSILECSESEYSSLLTLDQKTSKVGQWVRYSTYKQITGKGAWMFNGEAQWEHTVTLDKSKNYKAFIKGYSEGGEKVHVKKEQKIDEDGEWRAIFKQNGAQWSLTFQGTTQITKQVGDPTQLGQGSDPNEKENEVEELLGEVLSEDEKKELESELEGEKEEEVSEPEIEIETEPEAEPEKEPEPEPELETEPETESETNEQEKEENENEGEEENENG